MSVSHLPSLGSGGTASYGSRYQNGGSNGILSTHDNDGINGSSPSDPQGYGNEADVGALQLPSVSPTVSSPVNKNSPSSSDSSQVLFLRPGSILKHYSAKLSPYEQKEIVGYDEIYYAGLNAKKRQGSAAGGSNNNGYDDEQGSYLHVIHDHLVYRYEVLKVIGKGSFGHVMKAYDHKTRTYVAVKIVRNEKRFHRQAAEEIRILEQLRSQDADGKMNIVHMQVRIMSRRAR